MLRRCATSVVLFIVAGCVSADAGVHGADANQQPLAAYELLPGRSARTVLHEEVNEAENLFFTEDGRLFVSGGEDIYEFQRTAAGTFTKTTHFDEDCLVEGIVQHGQYLYGACTIQDGSLRAFLIAGELTADPVFRTIAPLETASAPNGLAFDPEGRLYITCSLTHRIVRITLASPLEVERTESWAEGLSLVNGIKYVDHAMYVTTLELTLVSRFLRIPLLADGRAGWPEQLYARGLSVLDDIMAFEDGFIVTDFLNGTLILWDERQRAFAETPAGTFFGPTSLARGRAPMFDPSQLIVAEKGTFLVRDERDGDLLSVYQLP